MLTTDAATHGLELPLDAPRTATTSVTVARHELTLPAIDEATLVAAFAIQLARYNGQAAIPITASRLGDGWCAPLAIETRQDLAVAAVVAQARAELQQPATHPIRGDGSRAALTWARDPAEVTGSEADLHLVAGAGAAAFLYNASVLSAASVERFAGHLRTILEGLEAEMPVGRVPLLTPEERAWLEQTASGGTRPLPQEPLHRRVERHARETPDAPAVHYGDQVLSYAELDRRANRLARELVARGAKAEARVVVCLEPSLDIAIAVLAIWKAGAVYVPLEPTYPAARIAAILEDTQPIVTVTRPKLRDRLGLTGTLEPDAVAEDAAPLDVAVAPGDTAYIYYTSGTTGKPKGVMASHANLIAYIQSAVDRYAMVASDVMPAIARFSFSISMFELMAPLVAGGTLLVLDREHVLDPARLARTLATVTFFHAGPSLLKSLIAQLRREPVDMTKVRHASSGGDLIPPEVLQALVDLFPSAEVFVIYGCSEIACMGTTYPVPRNRPVTRTFVGKPFENVIARVVDRAGQPCPIGVVGEVWFAGGGVVKGYLNRPELTAEKFVERDGLRYYRTGDLGRVSEGGWIELLGRNDFQIKIRGMRIELADIEYTLRRAPGVRDGVVVTRPTPTGEKMLVAYVVGETGALRRYMHDHLPDYMVPAIYVELESLPLNHNMKVDRNALPAPVASASVREPTSTSELALAAIWQRLLRVDRVHLDQNFFELGGDSMTAMELLVVIERELGVVIDGLEVVRETLEVLAAVCDRKLGLEPPEREHDATDPPFTPFFAGDLYAVIHGTRGDTAALIVAPPTQDRVRAYFVLVQLARSLARRGVPAMLFDFYGHGDSQGELRDATVERWLRDITDMRRVLGERTGAKTVVGVGVRLGATLLAAAQGVCDRTVLWDPVIEGASWLAEASAMQREHLRGLQHLRLGRRPRAIPGCVELLGGTYAAVTLRALEAMRLAAPRGPVAWLVTSNRAHQVAAHARLGTGSLVSLDLDYGWRDASHLDDILPDPGISRALADMVSP